MEQELAFGLAGIVVFGVGAQWLAGRLRLPSILLLLAGGLIAGPVLGIVVPDVLFGELLFPLVSMAVGVLLFEGGLGLNLARFHESRSIVIRLITIGVVITWVIGAFAAKILFGLPISHALLLAAVLVVSGPTVVLPLLRQARPNAPVGPILRWEGIVIDPIGAMLAVIVLGAVLHHEADIALTAVELIGTTVVGSAIGLAAAGILAFALSRFVISDHLQNPVALLLCITAYTGANAIFHEAGLFATTVMGIALANQRISPTSHIVHFQEELGPLIIAGLFILLGARVDLGEVQEVLLPALGLVLVLVLIARPLTALVSTAGTDLDQKQRIFLASMAPRGIVAAAVSSLFALKLEEAGIEFGALVPITFVVIAGTVIIYGLGAVPLAKMLGVAKAKPNGVALVGAAPWVLQLAHEVRKADVPVLIVASQGFDRDVEVAQGIEIYEGSVSSDEFLDRLDEVGISEAIATTRNTELNGYVLYRLVEALGRRHVFQLPGTSTDRKIGGRGGDSAVWGRRPFYPDATQHGFEELIAAGAQVTTEVVDPNWTPENHPITLFAIDAQGQVTVSEYDHVPPAGTVAVCLRLPQNLCPADVEERSASELHESAPSAS